jgi:transcriptional regulator with XRE-family HTH domain
MGIARQSPPTPELRVFSDRLQKIIEFNKTDIGVLAKSSEYKPDDIHKLLTGMREPGMKKLILLADSLGCSVDYLLGLTPTPQRASVVVEVDTNALNHQSSERGQTSGQISGKIEPFIAMVSKLPESDIELLIHIAGFLIERKNRRLAKIVDAITSKSSEKPDSISKTSRPKDDDFIDDDFEEDDLWGDTEDEFEDDEFEEDDFEDEDEDDEGDEDFDD